MLKSMTGYGRCTHEGDGFTMTWEVRSVNSRHLDLKWRLPMLARSLETRFEKTVRKFGQRGRVEITLNLQIQRAELQAVSFNNAQASAMLDELAKFANERGDDFAPDYTRMLGMSFLWEDSNKEPEKEFAQTLVEGLELALADWNEARATEATALSADMLERTGRMRDWVETITERAPQIKEERFATLRDRLTEVLARVESELEEQRFLQEITVLSDKLDVSEEITRLNAHLERLEELIKGGGEAGKRLDFTLQECFREVNTCGNKIQDQHIARIIVDFKNELEKCREQVQNLE
ncbi:YicC/YloC family endoribonuclease [Halodesulfovibrio aestuarii]|uniref:TIGR00255 family protein n=1 Tax=Halodesulfovibrio aestuarii TaxID=126333 RepID=A0A8G2CC21_9BACT|nr:YicC/YloC family endoribonuclease [Halodesulfovibrio aestuarii]SHJ48407.1 TIGR00255 family protein [Halodesulfovibrio aestuarii]